MLELAEDGRDDEETMMVILVARARREMRASEWEKGGPKWFGRTKLVRGLDQFGLTSGPRGKIVFSELV
jgi:hypothetical protein